MPLPVKSVWRRFGGAVDRDEEIGLALSGTGLGDIDMQIAQRIVLEGLFLTARLRARQLADAVALEEAVKLLPSTLATNRSRSSRGLIVSFEWTILRFSAS
ncbi:hypothetical protein [Azotobacter beijerinckii]|uniref:hypothetical protein n=1 Tax=Azotobacter beijerinckii TaxID=170623 RepID=UPI000B843916